MATSTAGERVAGHQSPGRRVPTRGRRRRWRRGENLVCRCGAVAAVTLAARGGRAEGVERGESGTHRGRGAGDGRAGVTRVRRCQQVAIRSGQGQRGRGAGPETEDGDEGPQVDDRPDDQGLTSGEAGQEAGRPGRGQAERREVSGEAGVGVGVGVGRRELVDGVVERVGRGRSVPPAGEVAPEPAPRARVSVLVAAVCTPGDYDRCAGPPLVPALVGDLAGIHGSVTRCCHARSMARWTSGEVLAFDFETTGIDRFNDVPVSYALVLVEAGIVVRSWSGLIDPGRDIPAEATEVHGITSERARAEGMPLDLAVAVVTDAIVAAGRRGVPVAGMKLDYDLTMVDTQARLWWGHGLSERGWTGPVLDASVIDRHVDPERQGRAR